MKITSLKIMNFRGITDMDISFERFNIMVGPCGVGKSSVLMAMKWVLTGIHEKTDINSGSDKMSCKITFEDGTTIARMQSNVASCYVNEKKVTAKALNQFIEEKIGTSTSILEAMCGTDYYEMIENKDLTKFILSILPISISFTKMIEFLEEQQGRKCTAEEKNYLSKLFTADQFGLKDIENAYNQVSESKKIASREYTELCKKAEFNKTLPTETKEELNALMEKITFANANMCNYQKAYDAYLRSVKQRKEYEEKLEAMKKKLSSMPNVTKPDASLFEKNKMEKKQFEDAIIKINQTVSTNNANISMFEKSLANLEKPVCPLSEKLVCSTDKTGLKNELQELISQNKMALQEALALISRCREQIEKRNTFIDSYTVNLMAYQEKELLSKQIESFKIPDVLEKPEVIKPDSLLSRKQEILEKQQIFMEYDICENARKKAELKQQECTLLKYVSNALSVSGVQSKILEKSLGPLLSMANEKATKINPDYSLQMTCDEKGVNIQVCPKGKKYVSLKSISSGEFIFSAYLIMTIIHKITNVPYLFLDNMDKLDSTSASALLNLLQNETNYSHIICAGVNHSDFVDLIKTSSINVINM